MNRPKLPIQNWICRLTVALAILMLSQMTSSDCAAQEIAPGTNSRKAKEEAQNAFPLDQLNAEAQRKIGSIVRRPSIYRRLPVSSIEIDPDYYLHLIRHPEVVINIWQLMGVTEMLATRTAPYTLETDDGAGTIGKVELVYGTNNLHVFYGEGEYRGSMLAKNLRGKIVLMLRTDYRVNAEGRPEAVSQMDIFVQIENATLNLVAKTLSPIIGTTADHNFTESINFLQRLNETTVNNGPGVQGMAHKLENLTPEVRRKFVQAAGLVFDRAQAGVQYGSSFHTPSRSQQDTRVAQNPYAGNSNVTNMGRTGFVQNSRTTSPTNQSQLTMQTVPTQRPTANPYSRGSNKNLESRSVQRVAQSPSYQLPNHQTNQTHRTPMTQAPIQQTIGDQPNNAYPSRPAYSSSRQPYSNNPYYGNRNPR